MAAFLVASGGFLGRMQWFCNDFRVSSVTLGLSKPLQTAVGSADPVGREGELNWLKKPVHFEILDIFSRELV